MVKLPIRGSSYSNDFEWVYFAKFRPFGKVFDFEIDHEIDDNDNKQGGAVR
jgi:hypothetical protein